MYKVHVGCLPACSTRESLVEFFKVYGDVREAKVLRKARSLCSGNGILICGDEPTQSRIVEIKTFFFNGRTIFCEPMLSGAKLKEKNKELSERRLFLSNLPSHIQDIDLGRLMSKFGPVQNAYRIRSIDGEFRPFGFVTFYDIAAAKAACKARKAYFLNTTIYISDFRKSNSLMGGPATTTNHSVNSHNKNVGLPNSMDWNTTEDHTIMTEHGDEYSLINSRYILYNTEHPYSEMFGISNHPEQSQRDQVSASPNKPTSKEYFSILRLDKWVPHETNIHNVRINKPIRMTMTTTHKLTPAMKPSDNIRCPQVSPTSTKLHDDSPFGDIVKKHASKE